MFAGVVGLKFSSRSPGKKERDKLKEQEKKTGFSQKGQHATPLGGSYAHGREKRDV